MTDPFTPASLHLVEQPPIATATHEESKTVLQSAALRDFIRERIEQIEKHGFTPSHDAYHDQGEIAQGAIAYILAAYEEIEIELASGKRGRAIIKPDTFWPWGDMFKPGNERSCLIKAIAMLWAEVDRIDATQELIEAARPLIPQDDE